MGWWYLGVVLCFTAAFLLVRRDAAAYRRQWIADGGTSRSWWFHVGKRMAIIAVVSFALVQLLKSPIGERFGHFVEQLLR